jgi:hypothetical protein
MNQGKSSQGWEKRGKDNKKGRGGEKDLDSPKHHRLEGKVAVSHFSAATNEFTVVLSRTKPT